MRKFFPFVISVFLIFAGGRFSVEAQTTTASGSGKVVDKKQPNSKNQTSSVTNTPAISKTDFKNFTYPVPESAKLEKTFTLRNGVSVKTEGMPNFTLRKTYFFDLTGDGNEEAITHILADGCLLECESTSLFFIHTPENAQARLLWKIAIGGDATGGLKAVNFSAEQIVLETFGDCWLDGWLVKAKIDLTKNPKLKTMNYTRFVFTGGKDNFARSEKDVLPLTEIINLDDYRPKITFSK